MNYILSFLLFMVVSFTVPVDAVNADTSEYSMTAIDQSVQEVTQLVIISMWPDNDGNKEERKPVIIGPTTVGVQEVTALRRRSIPL